MYVRLDDRIVKFSGFKKDPEHVVARVQPQSRLGNQESLMRPGVLNANLLPTPMAPRAANTIAQRVTQKLPPSGVPNLPLLKPNFNPGKSRQSSGMPFRAPAPASVMTPRAVSAANRTISPTPTPVVSPMRASAPTPTVIATPTPTAVTLTPTVTQPGDPYAPPKTNNLMPLLMFPGMMGPPMTPAPAQSSAGNQMISMGVRTPSAGFNMPTAPQAKIGIASGVASLALLLL